MTDWRAVGYGFVVTFLVGLIGLAIPGLGQLTAGLVGGFVAGYVAKHNGFTIGEDVFVAHCPERIAAGHFLEEIATLPCIVGVVGERACAG